MKKLLFISIVAVSLVAMSFVPKAQTKNIACAEQSFKTVQPHQLTAAEEEKIYLKSQDYKEVHSHPHLFDSQVSKDNYVTPLTEKRICLYTYKCQSGYVWESYTYYTICPFCHNPVELIGWICNDGSIF